MFPVNVYINILSLLICLFILRLLLHCRNGVPLSLDYNGCIQWVAVAGEDEDGEGDKSPWYGMVVGSRHEEECLFLEIIWLECQKECKKYHILCESQPLSEISADTVIIFGLEVDIHVVRKTKASVFRVKTRDAFIKQIWHSPNRRQLFDNLVTRIASAATVTTTDVVDNDDDAMPYQFINTDIWKSSAELAKSILKEARRLVLPF